MFITVVPPTRKATMSVNEVIVIDTPACLKQSIIYQWISTEELKCQLTVT